MEIKMVKVEDLKPYENNPRFNDDAVEYVANSIKKFGFKVPMIIDKNNVIVAGHTRYKASLELNLKEVPCIIADDLTEEQIKAFRLADNKVAEKSSWDLDLLGDEIKELAELDFNIDDLTSLGFGSFELSMLEDDVEPEGYDDELIEQYSENSEEFLKSKRTIITYTEEQEPLLKKLLGIDDDKEIKVLYKFEELNNEINTD